MNDIDEKDIRWKQRFSNYQSTLRELEEELEVALESEPSRIQKKSIIKSFEMLYELSWNTLKDYLEYEGHEIAGPREALEKGFSNNLITEHDIWQGIMKSRNRSSHIYDENIAETIYEDIIETYLYEFRALEATFSKKM